MCESDDVQWIFEPQIPWLETKMYADLVRLAVMWNTAYGKGGNSAPIDFDVGTLVSPGMSRKLRAISEVIFLC